MPTIYEFALLCQDVYLPASIPPSTKLVAWDREDKVLSDDSYSNHWKELISGENKGFFARLYIRKNTQQPVIAFRGTILCEWHNLEGDYQIWLNKLPLQFHAAFLFYLKVLEYLQHINKTIKPMLTGHSLGGVLANLIAAKTNLTSVAFNAPGIDSFPHINRNFTYSNIYNIDLQADLIHKIGKSIGNIQIFTIGSNHYLSLSQIAIYDALKYLNLNIVNKMYMFAENHSIDNLVIALEFDPALKDEVVN